MLSHRPILQKLLDAGHEAYFVGGCVRDHLLGRECKDIDICTSADAIQIAEIFPDSKAVGASFGVVLVKYGEVEAEVATFRTDGIYGDHRRPAAVTFTRNYREDLARRDFTMNAMMIDINGREVDPYKGALDVALKMIATVGNPEERFQEDALRMLRAVRFAAQLGFDIDPKTLSAIIDNAPFVEYVSMERVQIELIKILVSGRAAQGIGALWMTGLLKYSGLREVSELRCQEQNPKHHPEGDVFTHTLGLLNQLPAGCSLTLALAALLHDIGKPATAGIKDGQPTFYGHEEAGAVIAEKILRRLKYPNEVIDKVVSLVERHMTFRYVQEMRRSKKYRFLRGDNFDELLELHRMDATAGSGNLEHYEYCKAALAEVPPEVLRPVKLITGDDLIAYGLQPGPEFKRILTEVETLQLEGTVTTRGQALDAVQDLIDDKVAA